MNVVIASGKRPLVEDIQWTTDLGNAFLAQQKDVFDAVQRMRSKAQDKGSLKSSEQMKVQTQTIESKEVIIIEQSNPQVVYVPQYDPVVVYGSSYPAYPYPPIYYPPYYGTGAAIAAGAIGFGLGMMAVMKDSINLIRDHYGEEVDLAHLPPNDPQVYAALQRAEIGRPQSGRVALI